MKTISLCMIVRNEELVLERCLEGAARFAEEIIIVDTGSMDATKDIAARYTEKVYDFQWRDDFAAARNYSYSFAACDYIMWLDADDVIEPQGVRDILRLKGELGKEPDVVTFLYGGDVDQQNVRVNDFLLRDRLMKRSLDPQWVYPVHEAIPIKAEYRLLHAPHIVVHHRKEQVNDKNRNIRILEDNRPLNAYNRYYYCRELYYAGRYGESREEYARIREAGPPNLILNALPYVVWGLKDQGAYDEALRVLLDSIECAQPDEFVCCELGSCYLRGKRYDRAEVWLEKALETTVDYRDYRPHFLAYQKFLPYLQLGVLHARQGEWGKAYQYNERALDVFPRNTAAGLNRLYYQRCLGQAEEEAHGK